MNIDAENTDSTSNIDQPQTPSVTGSENTDSTSNDDQPPTPSVTGSENSQQEATVPIKIRNNKYNWQRVYQLDDLALSSFVKGHKYKFICNHNNIKRKCNVEPCDVNPINHQMTVSHLKCVSQFCCREDVDECPFQYQVRFCPIQNLHSLYVIENVAHSHKYIELPPMKETRIGMHPFYISEVERLLEENPTIFPSKILAILTSNLLKQKYDPTFPFPKLDQIQGS